MMKTAMITRLKLFKCNFWVHFVKNCNGSKGIIILHPHFSFDQQIFYLYGNLYKMKFHIYGVNNVRDFII